MRIVLAGGNGFIGRELTRALIAVGHEVVWLSHRTGRAALADTPPTREVVFEPDASDAEPGGAWRTEVDSADVVVNLSGYPIASRWNQEVMVLLRTSRLDTTRALAEQLARSHTSSPRPNRAFIVASAVGIYGDRGSEQLPEDAPPGTDLLATLAVDWEAAAEPARLVGIRTVHIRTGIVLGAEGVYPRMRTASLLFAGGPVGSGKQWVSWVHLSDIVGIYRHAIESATLEGPVNACAPQPVTMSELSRAVGRSLRRPSWLPVPTFGLRIILGRVAPYTVMSQRMTTEKIAGSGYMFAFPTIDLAMRDLSTRR